MRLAPLVVLVLVACTKADKESPPIKRAEPLASASAPPSPAASAPPQAFKAWTDPGGVDALLRGTSMSNEDKDPTSCVFDMPEQSCIPGTNAVIFGCRSECARACGECDSACRAKLGDCRRACAATDAACARTCATTAGTCVQGCLKERDGCATGTCAKEVAEYEKDVRTKYGCKGAGRPFDICKRASACIDKCRDAPTSSEARLEACTNACKKAHLAGCKETFAASALEAGSCMQYDDSP